MSDAPAASTDPREDMRRRWLAHAAAAFDLMFHPDHQPDLVTFDQREARACELGRDLTTWLVQQHANADEMAHPAADREVLCPRCGRPARRKTDPGGAPPGRVATVMVDGGRYQAREPGAGPGVSGPAWHEVKVACCQTLAATAHAADPQPDPPAKFLDPVQAARLAAEIKSRGRAAAGRTAASPPRPRRRREKRRRASRKLVRTV